MKFRDLAWGAFLFAGSDYPTEQYDILAADSDFLQHVSLNPSIEHFQKLRDFLTHYGVPWAPKDLAGQYLAVWPRLQGHIHKLSGLRLDNCDLGKPEIYEAIASAYECLQSPHVWGSSTVASKTLHFFNIDLFMMWDADIEFRYRHQFGTRNYVEFLQKMQGLAFEMIADFRELSMAGEPAAYLSKKLGYKYARPLTKFLDDYNWITVTKRWPSSIPEWLLNLHSESAVTNP